MITLTLTKQRTFFDEPIVRAKVSRVRFPKACPVCGAPANKHARISTTPRRKVWLRPHWDPSFNMRNRNRLENTEIKSFVVDVCEDHVMSDDAELKIRSLSIILA